MTTSLIDRRLHAGAAVGRRYAVQGVPVDPDRAADYARAVGDDPSRYGRRSTHPCFFVNPMMVALDRLLGDPEIGAARAGMLHAQSDVRFIAPLVPGEAIDVRSEIVDIGPYGWRDGMRIAATVVDRAGRKLVDVETLLAFASLALDGVADRQPLGHGERVRARQPSVHGRDVLLDRGLPSRYTAASGDHNPIHLDDGAARAVGLPGVILHGMSTLAVGCTLAIDGLAGGDPRRLARVRVRFSRPACPGSIAAYRFFTTEQHGRFAVTCDVDGAAIWKQSLIAIR